MRFYHLSHHKNLQVAKGRAAAECVLLMLRDASVCVCFIVLLVWQWQMLVSFCSVSVVAVGDLVAAPNANLRMCTAVTLRTSSPPSKLLWVCPMQRIAFQVFTLVSFSVFFCCCLVLLTKISVWRHTMLLGLHSVQKRRTTIQSSLVKQLFIVSLWRTSSRWLCYALQSSFVVRSHSASCREIAAYFSYRSGCEFIHFACLLLYVSQRENNCKYILQKSTHRPVNIIIYNMRAIWERANTIWFIRCSFVSRIILLYICTSVQICIVRCSWTTFPTSSKSRISVWRSAIFHCYK